MRYNYDVDRIRTMLGQRPVNGYNFLYIVSYASNVIL